MANDTFFRENNIWCAYDLNLHDWIFDIPGTFAFIGNKEKYESYWNNIKTVLKDEVSLKILKDKGITYECLGVDDTLKVLNPIENDNAITLKKHLSKLSKKTKLKEKAEKVFVSTELFEALLQAGLDTPPIKKKKK